MPEALNQTDRYVDKRDKARLKRWGVTEKSLQTLFAKN